MHLFGLPVTCLPVILLLCSLNSHLTSAKETTFTVPNPFKGLSKTDADNYYYIRASQKVNERQEWVEEFFSLGQGFAYSVHQDLSGDSKPWALLVDGRQSRSYILRNVYSFKEQEIDCELDHLHSHKHLFPWQYVYDIDEVAEGAGSQVDRKTSGSRNNTDIFSIGLLPELDQDETKRQRRLRRRRNKATIYGIGAVWLNLIRGDVTSSLVGPQSPYAYANSWRFISEDLDVEMLFGKTTDKFSGDRATTQSFLDKTEPKELKVNARVRYKGSSAKRQVESLTIEKFLSGLKEERDVRLQRFRIQLEICKKANQHHRQFPNLMRALASSSERLYKIDYVTRKYNLYGLGELDGKYHDKHHRFLWPYELTSEVFSLNHDIQTIIYDPSFMASQKIKRNGARVDKFMSSFTESAAGKSVRHATTYYHVMFDDEKTGTCCIMGEREPKPKYRLLSSPFTFQTAKAMQHEGHVHGLGALLLNAAHMHYKSFSLFDLEIQVPIHHMVLNNRRMAQVNVWQVFDKHDKVRVLFYIEKRDPTIEPFSWDLADRDRNDLARLVRVDLRQAPADTDDETSLIIDKALVDQDEDMLAQYFIFNFEFELDEHEAGVYFEVPKECKQGTPSADDQDSSDEDEDPFHDAAEDFDKPYDESYDSDNLEWDSDSEDDHNWAGEYQQLEGLETSDTPLPDFIEMLGDRTDYKFVTRLELLDDDDQVEKLIWLVEKMDLANERLSLKVHFSRETIATDEPLKEFFIVYENELVFKVTEDRSCLRIDDVDSLWMRLFSGHLYYHVDVPVRGHKINEASTNNDLVIESNSLSSYGIGALWRRASESGLAEYLGTRRERLERDGHRYRQLEWLYLEYDMSMRFSFLLEENQDGSHLDGAKPQLESVLFLNHYADEYQSSRNFKTIKATVERAVIGLNVRLVVPLVCRAQLIEAEQIKELEHEIKPPSHEEVLGPSGTYELRYTVHGPRDVPQGGYGHWMDAQVSESFDRKLNRGKIVIQEPVFETELEIYIDGQSKRMFAMSKLVGQCSILTSLGPTYNSILSSLIFDNEEFDPNRMHGLLGMWQMLSEKHAKVQTKQMFDMLGSKHEQQVYRIEQVKPPKAGKPEAREEIKMYFDKRQRLDHDGTSFKHEDNSKKRLENHLVLDRFEFIPIDGRIKRGNAEMDSTSVIINRQRGFISDEWVLPEECKQLLGPGVDDASTANPAPSDQSPETPPVGNIELPKISYLFGKSSRLHMRSEVNIKGALDTLYLVDELHNGQDVRIRTRGLGKQAEKNCDLLLFQDTLDQFDLSTPLKCDRLYDAEASHCLQRSLHDVWLTGSMARVDRLSHLHYGPLTLWKLAEKAAKSGAAKLIKTLDISTKQLAGQSLEVYEQALEREMNREVWLISGQNSDWSYEMEFVKHQRPLELDDGTEAIDEWHVLESITASDIQDGTEFSVFIDVVNYNYQPNNDEFRALFRLPEGWNCRRKWPEDGSKLPELHLGSPKSGVRLDYEASLELFDAEVDLVYEKEELGSLSLKVPERIAGHLPTLLGAYWISGDLMSSNDTSLDTNKSQQFDLTVHQSLTRFANGKALSRRIITDRGRQLEYEVDTMSGSCKANVVPNSGWKLNFRTEDWKEAHLIRLFSIGSDLRRPSDRDLFVQLFLGSPDKSRHAPFFLLDKYVVVNEQNQKVLYTSYESEHDLATLTNDLSGPARIVRKYEQLVGSDGFQSMDFMTAQVYLLSPDKLKLRAILTIRLQVNPHARLDEFLGFASVTDCFNEVDPLAHRQVQSFTLEYPMLNLFDQHLGRAMKTTLLHDFYANLLRLSGSIGRMFPMQLDGRAHLEFSQHDRLLRVHFDVMEAPSATVYFNTKFQCAMVDEMAALAESRHMPNEAACSRWCDQINCLAMSYCSDHLCRVATEFVLFRSSSKTKKKSSEERAPYAGSLADCRHHESCTYYHYKPEVRPPTLNRLRDYLDRIVNRIANQKQLDALSLPLDLQMKDFLFVTNRVTPTRFYESEEMFRWQHEDFDDPFAADSSLDFTPDATSRLQMAAGSFALWKQASRFDVNKIDKLNEELKFGHDSKFIISWAVASNKANCLQECQRNRCLLVTSCKNENRCEMIISTGSKSIISLGALKRELVKPSSPDCTISIREHLDQFHLFEGSQKPDKFSHRLDDYTVPECAAACQLSKAECLSFDLCSFMDETSSQLPERSVCFLQHDHVSQDSFDRSKLLASWETASQAGNRNTIDNRQVSCDHYSKSVVAEFRRVPNAKLKEPHASVLRGVSVDKCAADCLQDDACRAFEYCQNLRRHPTQSCYLIRLEGEEEAHWLDSLRDKQPVEGTNVTESKREKLDEHLILSKSCSIYVAKEVLLREQVDHTFSLGVGGNELHSSIGSILLVCLYLLIAAMVGAVLQFFYIRATGRTVLSLRLK